MNKNKNIDFINTEWTIKTSYSLSANKDTAKKLLEQKTDTQCYLLGRNEHSESLLNIIKISGFIDDYEDSITHWHDKPIIKSKNIPENSIVINCSLAISPLMAQKTLNKIPGVTTVNFYELLPLIKDKKITPTFIEETRKELNDNLEKYKSIFEKLNDQESKEILNKLISYRLTGNINFMTGFSVKVKEQYFEPFIGDMDGSIFIDCGGFDGDTTEEFIKRFPNYKHIHIFEPSNDNQEKAKRRLKNQKEITYHNYALSDKIETLSFDNNSGAASSVSSTSTHRVQATTLDMHITDTPSFIKMDLEGWEIKALLGCKKHIKDSTPILAIAVYHKTSDFWKIPETILSIQSNYKIYLRHYTEGWSETVMYFIPQE